MGIILESLSKDFAACHPREAAHQKTKPTVGGFLPEAPKPGGFIGCRCGRCGRCGGRAKGSTSIIIYLVGGFKHVYVP